MNEDQCECHWSGVVCPVNLKRKARLKMFFLQNAGAVWIKKCRGNYKLALNVTNGCILTIYLY